MLCYLFEVSLHSSYCFRNVKITTTNKLRDCFHMVGSCFCKRFFIRLRERRHPHRWCFPAIVSTNVHVRVVSVRVVIISHTGALLRSQSLS